MSTDITFNFFIQLKDDNLSFIYQGEFNDDITTKILSLGETQSGSTEEPISLKRKVSVVMAECFQNILLHGEKPTIVHRTNNKPQMFLTRNIGNTFYIASSNLIENKKIESFKSKLEKINTLSMDALKSLYLEVMTNREFTDRGGAGLGLMSVIKKTGQKLVYDFEYINYFLSIFHLQMKLVQNPEPAERKELSLTQIKKNYHDLNKENILLLQKGNFSQDLILPLLAMIENNLHQKFEKINVQKRIFYVLTELLQNISKHAKNKDGKQEGIFIIGKTDNGYFINTGNIIENDKIETLKNHLEAINNQDKDTLTEWYKQILLKKGTSLKGGASLGLIEVARYSDARLNFDFKAMDEGSSFFSLSVMLF